MGPGLTVSRRQHLAPEFTGITGPATCVRREDDSESIVSDVRRRLAALLIVMASLLLAAGCVSVPTSGPIEKVEGQQPVCQNCVNVEVAFPAPGAEPKEIVEGYLRATSYYQPNYSVARQFLTRMAAEKWSPEDGASIYRGSLTATGDQAAKGDNTAEIKLGGQRVGSLGGTAPTAQQTRV